MRADFHVHLEEGPYSLEWWTRTASAMLALEEGPHGRHSYAWLADVTRRMEKRIREGAYAPGWLDLYLRRAKQLGLEEVGIVDHLYRFVESAGYYRLHMQLGDDEIGRLQRAWLDRVAVESMERFVRFIEQEKPKWERAGVRLRLGIEADYFPGGEQSLQNLLKHHPWDFVIGSVHFVDGWGFDNPETRHIFARHDLEALYDRHFSLVEQAIRSQLFDFVAHLDNLKVFGHRLPDESALLPYYRRIAKTLVRHDVATEINTGLTYRYPVKEMCPSSLFLDMLCEHGAAITLSSDAHFPDDLGRNVDAAARMLLARGVSTIATFSGRKRISRPLS